MDECVAVAVAEAVAEAVTEAVAEADQSIHDRSIHDQSIYPRSILIYRACAQNQASRNSPDGGTFGTFPDEMVAWGAIQTSTSTRRGPG